MSYLFCALLSGCASLLLGVSIGKRMVTKDIEEHIIEMAELAEVIKQRNNQFLSNYSDLYHKSNGCEGQFTDLDEYIMDMWID